MADQVLSVPNRPIPGVPPCPVCGLTDAAQKVSAVWRISQRHTSGGSFVAGTPPETRLGVVGDLRGHLSLAVFEDRGTPDRYVTSDSVTENVEFAPPAGIVPSAASLQWQPEPLRPVPPDDTVATRCFLVVIGAACVTAIFLVSTQLGGVAAVIAIPVLVLALLQVGGLFAWSFSHSAAASHQDAVNKVRAENQVIERRNAERADRLAELNRINREYWEGEFFCYRCDERYAGSEITGRWLVAFIDQVIDPGHGIPFMTEAERERRRALYEKRLARAAPEWRARVDELVRERMLRTANVEDSAADVPSANGVVFARAEAKQDASVTAQPAAASALNGVPHIGGAQDTYPSVPNRLAKLGEDQELHGMRFDLKRGASLAYWLTLSFVKTKARFNRNGSVPDHEYRLLTNGLKKYLGRYMGHEAKSGSRWTSVSGNGDGENVGGAGSYTWEVPPDMHNLWLRLRAEKTHKSHKVTLVDRRGHILAARTAEDSTPDAPNGFASVGRDLMAEYLASELERYVKAAHAGQAAPEPARVELNGDPRKVLASSMPLQNDELAALS